MLVISWPLLWSLLGVKGEYFRVLVKNFRTGFKTAFVREAGSGDYEEMLVNLRLEDKRRFEAHDEVLYSLKIFFGVEPG